MYYTVIIIDASDRDDIVDPALAGDDEYLRLPGLLPAARKDRLGITERRGILNVAGDDGQVHLAVGADQRYGVPYPTTAELALDLHRQVVRLAGHEQRADVKLK